MTYPACFADAAAFAMWKKPERGVRVSLVHEYCTDCTPEYKAQMLQQGRCAYPGVSFFEHYGDLQGRRSEAEVRSVRKARKSI